MACKNNIIRVIIYLIYSIPATLSYTVGTTNGNSNACQQLEKRGIKCEFIRNGIDCFFAINSNQADVCKVTAEEALVALPHLKDIRVIGEIRDEIAYHNDTNYQIIVVVRTERIKSFANLKGVKYCHPGNVFENLLITDYNLFEFEREILRRNDIILCTESNYTYTESYLKSLGEFFGQSCRPIQTPNKDLNEDLRKKYPSLVAFCEERSDFETALQCLVRNGDVAVTTFHEFNKFFQQPENQNSRQHFGFLCKNGNVTTEPCFWTKQSWDLIVTGSEQHLEIQNFLEKALGNHLVLSAMQKNVPPLSDLLYKVLAQNSEGKLYLRDPASLKTHMERVHCTIPDANDLNFCNNTVLKWCTISDNEQEKCKWLSTASINQGFLPVIQCVESKSKLECLKNAEQNATVDVVVLEDYGYIAERKKLRGITFTENKLNTQPSMVILIKSTIKSWADFKGKRACFPEYGGNEMLAFITHSMKNKNNCDYGEYISEFLGDSCIPGAYDDLHEVTMRTNREKLCKLCPSAPETATSCSSSYQNSYYKNGTLLCLKNDGDFAVVDQHSFPLDQLKQFKVFCKDGTIVEFDNGLINENCALATISQSQIVARKSDKRKQNYQLLFEALESAFVYNSPFEIFNEFHGRKDLLFTDSTTGFAKPTNHYVQSYQNNLVHIRECVEQGKDYANSSNSFIVSTTIILLELIYFILMQ